MALGEAVSQQTICGMEVKSARFTKERSLFPKYPALFLIYEIDIPFANAMQTRKEATFFSLFVLFLGRVIYCGNANVVSLDGVSNSRKLFWIFCKVVPNILCKFCSAKPTPFMEAVVSYKGVQRHADAVRIAKLGLCCISWVNWKFIQQLAESDDLWICFIAAGARFPNIQIQGQDQFVSCPRWIGHLLRRIPAM